MSFDYAPPEKSASMSFDCTSLQGNRRVEKSALLIGISGKLGAGKDTVAEIIQHEQPDTWKTIRFAHKLKEVVAVLTNTSLQENLSRDGKQLVPTGFTQSLGTLQQLGELIFLYTYYTQRLLFFLV